MHIAASREFRKSLSPPRGAWNEKWERAQFFIPDLSQTFRHLTSLTDFAISHIDTRVAALMMSSLQIVIDENNPDENWNDVYLLLTEFEIITINYDLSFFRLDQCTERVKTRHRNLRYGSRKRGY